MADNASFYIKTGLILLANASKYFTQLGIELQVTKTDKHILNTWIRRIDSVELDIRSTVSSQLAQTLRKEISENWETLAIQNVLGMMVQMDDEQRRQVETFTENLLNTKK
jgi:hypothetical protein